MKNNLNSIGGKNVILDLFNYFLLALIIIIICGPIFLVLNVSFKTNQEYLLGNLLELPKSLNFENYLIVMQKGNLALAFKNTGILIITSTFGSILMGTMVAYALGRFEFKLKKVLLLAFLIPTLIPAVTTQVATFTIIKNLNLYNTINAGIILYMATDILSIYMFLQFIEKIPYSLDESASIDGASYFRIFRSIILPQLKPAISTVLILKAVNIYNDMLTPYLYMPKTSLKTVTTALMSFSNNQNSQWNIMGAGLITVMIPTLILYLFMQRFIISGITEGAVKS